MLKKTLQGLFVCLFVFIGSDNSLSRQRSVAEGTDTMRMSNLRDSLLGRLCSGTRQG